LLSRSEISLERTEFDARISSARGSSCVSIKPMDASAALVQSHQLFFNPLSLVLR
jgi:hypothetical protein